MDAIYILLPAALLLGLIGLALMIWSVKSGQFDDMEGPSYRILFDDDKDMIPTHQNQKAPKEQEEEEEENQEDLPPEDGLDTKQPS
ncbi:MAG: cbb3-type cytochrome oxidase assembly protein CcoS [Magnetococcales bacterium]|nr:cbb3-type cytochrome oxidase assembly protein CcoS [Magnetococcales bacterium]